MEHVTLGTEEVELTTTYKEHLHELPFPVFEYGVLFLIGCTGMAENVGIIFSIMCKTSFRKSSNAFVAHHSFLNLIIAGYCIQYGFNVMHEAESPVCTIFGSVFFIALTATAFNIVGITMNEIYLLADERASIAKETANCFCVIFCILTIWFSSLILHLGITLLPGNPIFIKEVGHCTFKYGQRGNYVLHVMWITLLTIVLFIAIMHLKRYHNEITRPLTADETAANDVQQLIVGKNDILIAPVSASLSMRSRRQSVNLFNRRLRKFYTITAIILLFVFFWYPLFLLTLIDPNYVASPLTYKAATIFGGISCVAKPFALISLLRCNRTEKRVATIRPSRTTQTLVKSDSVADSEIFDI